MATLASLLAPGVVGNYTHFEATEIFAIEDGTKAALNIFTILVAEYTPGQPAQKTRYLNQDRMTLKSLPGWKYGIARHTRPIEELEPLVEAMLRTGEWSASGAPLRVGKLSAVPQQFVPPDGTTFAAWNKVLKNNFWNGSHVIEWADTAKGGPLKPFFEDSRRLQELSASVRELVPITLAALSDRLGNLVIQLPVNVIMSQFNKMRVSGAFTVDIAWNPIVASRPLRATCELEFDGTVSGYAAAEIQSGQITLPVQPGFGMYRGIIWDDHHQVLLAATGPGAFFDSVAININALTTEPRAFSIKDAEGKTETFTVGLITGSTTVVGDTRADETGGHTLKRMYKDQLDRLATERIFIQYKPAQSNRNAEHEKALADLRALIGQYGREGVWLWDPYLTSRDVWETLFHCSYANSDLRALTGALEPPSEKPPRTLIKCIVDWLNRRRRRRTPELTKKQKWIEYQRNALNAIDSNWLGLRLEYRVKHCPAGFGFHDRFLIFPRTGEDALAWSLGTSVNGIGMEHHILQRVDNGQLIRDAFLELWEQLDQPEHLIWKKP